MPYRLAMALQIYSYSAHPGNIGQSRLLALSYCLYRFRFFPLGGSLRISASIKPTILPSIFRSYPQNDSPKHTKPTLLCRFCRAGSWQHPQRTVAEPLVLGLSPAVRIPVYAKAIHHQHLALSHRRIEAVTALGSYPLLVCWRILGSTDTKLSQRN